MPSQKCDIGPAPLSRLATDKWMYGPRGFTDKVIALFGPPDYGGKRDLHYGAIPAPLLLQVRVPVENYQGIRGGESGPTVQSFMKFAESCPNSLFECIIITKARPDERLEIDGVLVPRAGCSRIALRVLLASAAKPDDSTAGWEVNGVKYHRYWWD